MAKNDIHHQVRQTLMNELGLTRESVRGIMEDIVEKTISKHMANLETSGFIRDIVRREIQGLAEGKAAFGRDTIRSMVQFEAQKQIKDFIENNLRIGPQ